MKEALFYILLLFSTSAAWSEGESGRQQQNEQRIEYLRQYALNEIQEIDTERVKIQETLAHIPFQMADDHSDPDLTHDVVQEKWRAEFERLKDRLEDLESRAATANHYFSRSAAKDPSGSIRSEYKNDFLPALDWIRGQLTALSSKFQAREIELFAPVRPIVESSRISTHSIARPSPANLDPHASPRRPSQSHSSVPRWGNRTPRTAI